MCEFVFAQVPSWEWTRSSYEGQVSFSEKVAVDHSGNVYAIGSYPANTIVFGSDTLYNSGAHDLFVLKYSPQGNLLWAKNFGASQEDFGCDIAVDNNNAVYITGRFSSDSLAFDTFKVYNKGMSNLFLTKMDGSGNVLWAKSAKGDTLFSNFTAFSLHLDNYGNVLLTGAYGGKIVFGNDTLVGANFQRLFVLKFDNSGNEIWARKVFCNTGNVYGIDITSGLNGKVFVVGQFDGNLLQADTAYLQNLGSKDFFVLCYDSSGHFEWIKHQDTGGLSIEEVTSIVSDDINSLYITGYFSSNNLVFGNSNLVNSSINESDAFLVKFDTLGNAVWAKSFGGSATVLSSGTYAMDITLSNNKALYLVGRFDVPSISIGGIILNGFGSGVYSNIFVAEYDTSGNSIWVKGADDCSSTASINGISSDLFGNVYVSGMYQGNYLILGTDTISHLSGFGMDCFFAKLSSNISGISTSQPSSNLVKIYPNPFKDELSVMYPDISEQEITLYDVCSRPLLHQKISKSTTLNTSFLASGIYFYRVMSRNVIIESGKLIKQ